MLFVLPKKGFAARKARDAADEGDEELVLPLKAAKIVLQQCNPLKELLQITHILKAVAAFALLCQLIFLTLSSPSCYPLLWESKKELIVLGR